MKIDIKELVDSFTEDEFGAVAAVINLLNESVNKGELYATVELLGDTIHERAEDDLNGNEAKTRD